MKLQFDAKQLYQIEAVNAVVDLFDGQPFVTPDVDTGGAGGVPVVPNRLDLDDAILLRNLQAVQERNLPERLRSADLRRIQGTVNGAQGEGRRADFCNFATEMETGTGKTYVYIRTALELARRYGMRKFIIVAPSIAVCEGVLKTFEITRQHFAEVFGNLPYHFCKYTSDNLSQVRQLALGESVELMVMTIDSFNKASNILLQSTDRFQGETPIHLLQATRPILILDEPQNMESEKSKAALANLDPLFALRYSATHRDPYNLVYRLTPAEAYRQGLVKKIEVSSVIEQGDTGRPYVFCEAITTKKETIRARLRVHRLSVSGTSAETTLTAKVGDDLQEITGRLEYAGYEVEEIDYGAATVTFANGIAVRQGEAIGADRELVLRAQIGETLRRHFEKQSRLRDRGIKVLSLFFIDKVANYAAENGIIRRTFNECFHQLVPRYPEWEGKDPVALQAAYFAQQKHRDGRTDLVDSSTGEAQKDVEAYDLIMRDKERLLSFDEPVCFVFSHSALREGWDNPNVFQICTLNETVSEMRKRQEIGRGIRLCVDQAGGRVFDDQVNVLTVVANEHYDRYVQSLQAELTDEGFIADEQGPPPERTDDAVTVTLRAKQLESDEFRELWEKIRRKTQYAVTIDTEALVKAVIGDLEALDIPEPQVVIKRVSLEITEGGAEVGAFRGETTAGRRHVDRTPDLVGMLCHHLEHVHPPCTLTRQTLVTILRSPGVLPEALRNPAAFVAEAARVIRHRLAEQIVAGIQYRETGEVYEQERIFETTFTSYAREVVATKRGLYDHVKCDSDVEKRILDRLDNTDREVVRFYTKLPSKFKVKTPIGNYNPDWAIVAEREEADATRERLYLIRETKSTKDLASRPTAERQKVRCGEKHFEALDVDFKVVTDAEELL